MTVSPGANLSWWLLPVEDFNKISLDEARVVLSVHMLCYVLDGDISYFELRLVRPGPCSIVVHAFILLGPLR
jgi:hypothetical protein